MYPKDEVSGEGGPTVLLVDDDYETRLLLRRSLLAQGYRVLEAVDEMEAVELAARERVDCVLTDLEMPSLGALLAISRVYAALQDVPVAALDGDAEEGRRDDGLHLLHGTRGLRSLLRH